MSQNLIYSQDALEKYVRNRQNLTLCIKVTAGVPSIIGPEQPKILIERGLAGSQVILSQTNINELLGVSDDVDASVAFGATAMAANDTLGLVLACDGQVESVDFAQAYVSGASSLSISEQSSSLPNSGFSGIEVLVTPTGNLVCRFDDANITAGATNTIAYFELLVRLK
jgi:hypothetical protein